MNLKGKSWVELWRPSDLVWQLLPVSTLSVLLAMLRCLSHSECSLSRSGHRCYPHQRVVLHRLVHRFWYSSWYFFRGWAVGAFLNARLFFARPRSAGSVSEHSSQIGSHTSGWSSRIQLQVMALPMVNLSDVRHATWNWSLYSPDDAVWPGFHSAQYHGVLMQSVFLMD